jgi:hypothetical protein
LATSRLRKRRGQKIASALIGRFPADERGEGV